ncbi:major facilitator superfamily domain-containing protein [Limtongia smithiae]|uniref:major facilitator superfamily domain-containing protein n=1 Tax=Limtongia smithiae TaxID=1125753 RepID=UPI0034CE3A2A
MGTGKEAAAEKEKQNVTVEITDIEEMARMAQSRLSRENVFGDDPNWRPNKFQSFLGKIWDSFEKPPNERRYLQKLDLFILSYSLFSYGLKSIDVNNISNAYVSGMQEDASLLLLSLYGQERNLMNTCFNAGYLVGSTPSQIIINRVRPSIWIPSCELVWSALVMVMSCAKGAKLIYIIRFFLGLLESCSYPGFAYILGCWYGPDELAKRLGVYDLAGYAANMFAGYIQTGIYAGLNGALGRAGWRWMFIIDGIMGFPIAFWGYFSIPDFPNDTRALWLTKKDREVGLLRMQALGKKPPRKLTPKRFFDMFFRSWRPWPFLVSYVLLWCTGTSSYFNLWLKALGTFTTEQINLIPTGGYGLGLVTGFLMANISDRIRMRWPMLFLATTVRLLGAILLSVWDLPFGAIFFGNLCAYMSEPVWSLLLAWAAEEFQDDAELRGLLAAVGNSIGASFSMWLPLLLFPSNLAPHYPIGYKVVAGLCGLDFMALFAFLYLAKRERAQRGLVLNAYGLYVPREEIEEYEQRMAEAKLEMSQVGMAPAEISDEKKLSSEVIAESELQIVRSSGRDFLSLQLARDGHVGGA